MTVSTTEPKMRRSPTSDQFDHATKCYPDRALAEHLRDSLRSRLTNHIDGQAVRWRVRKCPTCVDKFYVSRELRKGKA